MPRTPTPDRSPPQGQGTSEGKPEVASAIFGLPGRLPCFFSFCKAGGWFEPSRFARERRSRGMRGGLGAPSRRTQKLRAVRRETLTISRSTSGGAMRSGRGAEERRVRAVFSFTGSSVTAPFVRSCGGSRQPQTGAAATWVAVPSPVVRKGTVSQANTQGRGRFAVPCRETLRISLPHRVLNATNKQWHRAAKTPTRHGNVRENKNNYGVEAVSGIISIFVYMSCLTICTAQQNAEIRTVAKSLPALSQI
jgi:hypothetical protein